MRFWRRFWRRLWRGETTSGQDRPPQQATLRLTDGTLISCAVFEDPQRDAAGNRRFWLEPTRAVPRGAAIAELYLDRLPPGAQANLRLPPQPRQVRMRWCNEHGRHEGWLHRPGGPGPGPGCGDTG